MGNLLKIKYSIYWFLRKVRRKITKRPIVLKKYGKKIPISNIDANSFIAKMIKSNKSFMAARFGNTELGVLVQNEYSDLDSENVQRAFWHLVNNAGYFPESMERLNDYCALMFESSESVDLLGVWSNYKEDYIVEKYCKNATLCALSGLEPWYVENPWSAALEGKKVLIIHPFEKTIRNQYEKRDKIFPNTNILPEFEELLTIKAVQTIADEVDERFGTWFDALQWMYEESMKIDFDVAIIGCGAYGFPLAAMLKKSGKIAIHLGGATQLLFGIKGKRWDNLPKVSKLYNEHWVRPLEEERPMNNDRIEKGCYW